MLFIENKYKRWYDNIIENARNRELLKNTYTEKHHVIPKSLGGTNDAENLVVLTGREHFVCHYLLIKMTSGKAKASMSYAAWQMTNKNNRDRHTPTSRQYAEMRRQLSETYKGRKLSDETKRKIGKKSKGRKAFLGKQHTDETKRKISEAKQGISLPKTDETKAKMSATWKKIAPDRAGTKNPMYGKTHSKETKKLQSAAKLVHNNPMYGKHHTEETKEKMRQKLKVPKPKFTCEHCGKTVGGAANYARWHGDNCKQNEL